MGSMLRNTCLGWSSKTLWKTWWYPDFKHMDQRSWYYPGTPKMSCLQFEAFKSRDAQRFAHCLPSFPQTLSTFNLYQAMHTSIFLLTCDACNLVNSGLVCSPSDLLGCKSDKWILGLVLFVKIPGHAGNTQRRLSWHILIPFPWALHQP